MRDPGVSCDGGGRARGPRLAPLDHFPLRDLFQCGSRSVPLSGRGPGAFARLLRPPVRRRPACAPGGPRHLFRLIPGVQPVSPAAWRRRLLRRPGRPRLHRAACHAPRRTACGRPRVRARPDSQRRLDPSRVDRRGYRRCRFHLTDRRARHPHRRRSAGPNASPPARRMDAPFGTLRLHAERPGRTRGP